MVVRNVGLNFLSRLWFALLALVAVPYTVHKLGADMYGVYILVSVIFGYFAFLDLGLGSAATKYIAEYDAAGDEESVTSVVRNAMGLYLILGVVGASVVAATTPWLVSHVFSIPPHQKRTAELAFYISAVGFLINFPAQTFAIVPTALQRFDVIFKRTVFFGTLAIVATLGLLALGYGLVGIVAANIAVSLATAGAFYVQARRLLPHISFKPAWSRTWQRTLLSFGLFKASQRISTQIVFQLDRLVVGIFSPIAAVAYYAVPLSLTQRTMQLVGNVGTAVFPAASALAGQRDQRRIEELYVRALKLTALVALPTSAIMFFYAHQIMRYWIGGEFEVKSSGTLMILAVANLAYAFTTIPAVTLDAIGSIKVSTTFGWLAAGTNIVLVCTLVPTMGFQGAAWAVLANSALIVPAFLYYIHTRVFSITIGQALRRSIMRPSLALAAIAPVMILGRSQITSLVELGVAIGLTLLAFAAATLLTGCYDARDRALLGAFLPRRRRRRPKDPPAQAERSGATP